VSFKKHRLGIPATRPLETACEQERISCRNDGQHSLRPWSDSDDARGAEGLPRAWWGIAKMVAAAPAEPPLGREHNRKE
jgi:hypothetical protein